MICDAERDRWRGPQCFMLPHEIVKTDVQRHGDAMVFDSLGKTVAQSSKPLARHAQRQVRPLDITSRNLRRHAAYYITLYSDYGRRRVASGGFFYGKLRYGIGLGDHSIHNLK